MKNSQRVPISRDEGFIVQVLFIIFQFFGKISVFNLIRYLDRKRFDRKKKASPAALKHDRPFTSTYIFPEIWAVCNPLFAYLVSLNIVKHTHIRGILYVLLIYAIERTMEMFIYQVNVLFFDRMRVYYRSGKTGSGSVSPDKRNTSSTYMIKSATRSVILLIINMFEYVCQFAVMYACIQSLTGNNEYLGLLKSFEIFLNITDLDSIEHLNLILPAYMETLIGLFMNILCLARFIGMLPEVKVKDDI